MNWFLLCGLVVCYIVVRLKRQTDLVGRNSDSGLARRELLAYNKAARLENRKASFLLREPPPQPGAFNYPLMRDFVWYECAVGDRRFEDFWDRGNYSNSDYPGIREHLWNQGKR